MDNKILDAQEKTLYVSGILMDYQLDRFLLIDKDGMKLKDGTRLFWQGIGGHIHDYRLGKREAANAGNYLDRIKQETPHQAMEREFLEETGHRVKKDRWHCYHIKDYGSTKIYFFVAFCSPSEIGQAIEAANKLENPEGNIDGHTLVDVLFDSNKYTFDLPYLINMIIREMRAGFFMKLDPEGVNSSGKNT